MYHSAPLRHPPPRQGNSNFINDLRLRNIQETKMEDDEKCPRLGDSAIILNSDAFDQAWKQILITNRPTHQTPIADHLHFEKGMRECLDESLWLNCLHCHSLLLALLEDFERGNRRVQLPLAKPATLFGRDYVWDVAQTMIRGGTVLPSLYLSECGERCHYFKVYPSLWGVHCKHLRVQGHGHG